MTLIARRKFISLTGKTAALMALPFPLKAFLKQRIMTDHNAFDVIIIGGSYAGLAAGMALGRALKRVLIIDSDKPCNRQTPQSHNFITQDGVPPADIAAIAKRQVTAYDTVTFFNGQATSGRQTNSGFEIHVATGEVFNAKKLIFATGIKDIMPNIPGYAESWGISVLHCPYCHGYEVNGKPTGILANGEHAYELAVLISNWTKDLKVFTNGTSTLTIEQTHKLAKHGICIVEKEVASLDHMNGHLQNITFRDGTGLSLQAIYARSAFEQHCAIPATLGCALNDDGYIQVDALGETTIAGVYACGDNTTRIRSVANAVAMGTTAGMMLSKKMIAEEF